MKVLMKKLEESRRKGVSSCSPMCDEIAGKIMELRVRLQRLEKITMIVRKVVRRRRRVRTREKLETCRWRRTEWPTGRYDMGGSEQSSVQS